MSKIGLVVEGGGMKCAYSAGVLDSFLDENINFDYCIGVSAGSANIASYLAGQRGRNLRFYTDHIHEPGYFGIRSFLKTGDLFGLRYIYGTLTNSDGADYLDYEKMMENPSELVAVATNARTGKPAYFYKKEVVKDDYKVFMASCALPAVSRPVKIGGEYYYDGGVSDSIPVRKALADGCDKLVLILSKPRDYVKQPEKFRLFYSIACRKFPRIIHLLNRRHVIYMKAMRRAYELEKEGKAFIFAPSEHLPMGTYDMDEAANQKLYDLGLSDFQAQLADLKAFMNED